MIEGAMLKCVKMRRNFEGGLRCRSDAGFWIPNCGVPAVRMLSAVVSRLSECVFGRVRAGYAD